MSPEYERENLGGREGLEQLLSEYLIPTEEQLLLATGPNNMPTPGLLMDPYPEMPEDAPMRVATRFAKGETAEEVWLLTDIEFEGHEDKEVKIAFQVNAATVIFLAAALNLGHIMLTNTEPVLEGEEEGVEDPQATFIPVGANFTLNIHELCRYARVKAEEGELKPCSCDSCTERRRQTAARMQAEASKPDEFMKGIDPTMMGGGEGQS